MKITTKKVFFTGILIVTLLSLFMPNYLISTDILRNLPSFSQNGWERPKNSLLADPVFQFEPWRHFAKERILKREFPLWNDLNGKGSPFFANPQTTVLFPLNFIYYLFPVGFSLYFISFMKLYLLGFFMFIYLKSIKLSSAVSILGAISVSFFGFSMVWLQWPHTNVFLFLPLMLLITEKILIQKNLHRWYALLSFTYFFAVLGGHPETLLQITIVNIAYIIFRFWRKKKKIIPITVSIIAGFLLGSLALLPFAEYLINGFVLQKRIALEHTSFLPLGGFLFNFIPFLFGAPHLNFYKPLNNMNWQENIGGYTGPAIMLTALIGFFLFFKKDRNIRFWFFIVLVSYFTAYGIWPISFFSKIPPLNLLANNRLIGIAGFGLSIVAVLAINKLLAQKNYFAKHQLILKFVILASIVGATVVFLPLRIFKFNLTTSVLHFLSFLKLHIIYMSATTVLFFTILFLPIKNKLFGKLKIIILILLVLSQTAFLFFNYNTTVEKGNYYPLVGLTRSLEAQPKGSLLTVGNPALPANVNILYEIENSENNDAVEVNNYRELFDKAFPIKNQWGNVDRVSEAGLEKFGIRYVVSDYNLNLTADYLNQQRSFRLPPITSRKKEAIEFVAKESSFRALRLMTANFNRLNNCTLHFEIKDKEKNAIVDKSGVSCKDVRDFMFFNVEFAEVLLTKGKEYVITISSDKEESTNNVIALWGSKERKPFAEIYYDSPNNNNNYKLLFKAKNLYLWETPFDSEVNLNGSYSMVRESAEEIWLTVDLKEKGFVTLKKTYYPGWKAQVDGKNADMDKKNNFLSVQVPEGKHVIKVFYSPRSFLLGGLSSALTAIILCIYFIRKERNESWWKDVNSQWNKQVAKVKKVVAWWSHSLILLLAIVISILLFVFSAIVLNLKFEIPYTTAINWNTVHNYPKQQDLFYFVVGGVFVFMVSFVVWIISIWKKAS